MKNSLDLTEYMVYFVEAPAWTESWTPETFYEYSTEKFEEYLIRSGMA